MLVGTADLELLGRHAPRLPEFNAEPLVLDGVVCLQLTAELPNSAREAVLPPALHPTVPAALSIQVLKAARSPWGELAMATVRIACRSGVRARGYTVGAVVNSQAAEGLTMNLGYPAQVGEVRLRHGYDGAEFSVHTEQGMIAALAAVDPEPMGQNDVQFTGTLNLAHTPLGLRLLQVESDCAPSQVERLTPGMLTFDGAGWGQPLLVPKLLVSCSVVVAPQWAFAPIRFVCKPDELAFTGTESVS